MEPFISDQYRTAQGYFLSVLGLVLVDSLVRVPHYLIFMINQGMLSCFFAPLFAYLAFSSWSSLSETFVASFRGAYPSPQTSVASSAFSIFRHLSLSSGSSPDGYIFWT